MRPSFVALLCVLGSVAAAPLDLVSRDTLRIEIGIRSVQASLQNLAAVIQSLETHKQGNSLQEHVQLIQHHGQDLSTLMIKSAKDIRQGPDVQISESSKLLMPIQGLTDATQQAANAWIASRNTIIKSGGRETVYNILKRQQADADEFTAAMVLKLPEVSKYIGRNYAQRVRSSMDLAINYFR